MVAAGAASALPQFASAEAAEEQRLRPRASPSRRRWPQVPEICSCLILLHKHIALFRHAPLSNLADRLVAVVSGNNASNAAACKSDAGYVRLLHIALTDRAIHLELLIENRIGSGRDAIRSQIDHVRRAPG